MPEARVERRLTAILAGDVAGYSRLMGADEEGTLARLNAHRREFLEPKIAEHAHRTLEQVASGAKRWAIVFWIAHRDVKVVFKLPAALCAQ